MPALVRRRGRLMAAIELTTFRLVADVDDETFLAADEIVRTGFSYQQPGLLRSTTARDGAGGWIAVQLWESDDSADAAARRAEPDAAMAELLALIDPSTLEHRRYTTID